MIDNFDFLLLLRGHPVGRSTGIACLSVRPVRAVNSKSKRQKTNKLCATNFVNVFQGRNRVCQFSVLKG